jgi:hypothetical protein
MLPDNPGFLIILVEPYNLARVSLLQPSLVLKQAISTSAAKGSINMPKQSWKVYLAAACLSVALTSGPRFSLTPALAADSSFNASGDGKLDEGVYTSVPNTAPRAKPAPYTITLGQVTDESFLISGSLLLPASSGVKLEFGAPIPPAPKPAAGAPPVDPATLPPRPPVGLIIQRDATGANFNIARAQVTAQTPADQAIPLKIFVQKDTIEIVIGQVSEFRQRTNAPLVISLALTGAAKLGNLKVQPVDATIASPVISLEQKVNASLEGTDAPVGKIASGQAPKGLVEHMGISFYVPEKGAVDISKSMAGVKTPGITNKVFYGKNSSNSFGRTVVQVDGDQYSTLHLLAFSQGRPDHAPKTTVRVGFYGNMNGILEDIILDVPVINSGATNQYVIGTIPVTLADGAKGSIYHLAVPMAKTGNVKEFGTYDLEFTREMNTHVKPPDPNTFGQIPAGLPSDVVVLAASIEKSPVTMTYVTDEPGNVFFDTQKQVFKVTLTNRSAKPQKARAYVTCAGPGTGEERNIDRKTWTVDKTVDLAPGESKTLDLDVSPGKRGWFTATVAAEIAGKTIQQRDTTFAILAPDTRKATAKDSPFGIWEFWHAHSVRPQPNQVEILATLMNRGGWRHTYGGSPRLAEKTDKPANPDGEPAEATSALKEFSQKYNILFGLNNLPGAKNYQSGEGWYDEEEFNKTVPPALARIKANNDPAVKVLHESRSSLNIVRRYSELLGGKPYDMPQAEEEKLKKQVANVTKYTSGIRKADPDIKIILINDYPVVATEYMKRGFPKENFDIIGLEGAMFSRSPERQPDWLSLLGNTHEVKRAMKKYGYDKPLWTTEALYHATEAGALTLYQQSTIAVREAMMALQLGYARMAAAGLIKDPADDYHWSNWGSGGYCYRDPEINPKPTYAAYAWLTQVLDMAKPNGNLKTPNFSLHVVDFIKPDGSHVYSVWTASGVQTVTLAKEGSPNVWDFYGNPMPVGSGAITIQASTTPVYITDCKLTSVVSAVPIELPDANPGTKLLDFDSPQALVPVTERSPVVESHWDTPRLKGDFENAYVTQDGASALKITLKPDQDDRKLLPRYQEFKLAKPITLQGRPHEFTLRIKGNAGWGRIMFEVVDAKGRVWTSTGNQYSGASNSSDPHGQSMISFLGWQTIHFPVVGMYPGADQEIQWPRNYNWWAFPSPETLAIPAKDEQNKLDFEAAKIKYQEDLKAHQAKKAQFAKDLEAWQALGKESLDKQRKTPKPVEPKEIPETKLKKEVYMGVVPVDYPLTLTKVIVDMRPHVLYLNDELPVANPTIFIDNLGVTQPPKGQ